MLCEQYQKPEALANNNYIISLMILLQTVILPGLEYNTIYILAMLAVS